MMQRRFCMSVLRCRGNSSRWRMVSRTDWNVTSTPHTGQRSAGAHTQAHTTSVSLPSFHVTASHHTKRLVTNPPRCSFSSSAGTDNVADIQERSDHLSITMGNQTFRTSFLWLRDHCRCSACYEHTCFENFVDIAALPADIKPKHVRVEDNTLTLTWPDDHLTTYSLQWLQENAPGRRSAENELQPMLWDRERLMNNVPEDVHVAELRDGNGLRKIAENLHVYGFSFVSGLDATRDSTEDAIRLIARPMATHYGEVWQYQNDGEIADAGYTAAALKNHTDHTYFNHAAGGLVLHCLHHDGMGGENTLVDGFNAARLLRATQPEHYETLLTFPVLCHYLDKTYDFRCRHTVLRKDVLSGQLQQLRFNPHDRYTLSYASYEEAKRFYAAYRALGCIIDSPENEFQTKLRPGRMVVFDNWRMLHGRAGFTGKRVMVGCYYTYDDLQQHKRTKAYLDV